MSISAMSVVFCGLILLFIAFKIVGKVAVNLSKRNAMKSKGIDKHEAKELSQAPGEVYAAISMALNNKPGVSTATRNLLWNTDKYGYDFQSLPKA